MVPSARTAPSAITTTGSQNSSMMASSCSTMRIVIPSAQRRPARCRSAGPGSGWTPAIGSSRSSIVGLGHQRPHDLDQPALAAAQVTGVVIGELLQAEPLQDRFGPGDRGAPRQPASTACPSRAPRNVSPRLPGPRTAGSPSRCSRLNSLASWKVRTSPEPRPPERQAVPVTSRPCVGDRARRSPGGSRPAWPATSTCPAPFGPISPVSVPLRTWIDTPCHRAHAAEATPDHVCGLEQPPAAPSRALAARAPASVGPGRGRRPTPRRGDRPGQPDHRACARAGCPAAAATGRPR